MMQIRSFILLVVSAATGLAMTDAEAAQPKPVSASTASLGATYQLDSAVAGIPIHSGHLIVEGRCLEPPFVISRRGSEVFANRTRIFKDRESRRVGRQRTSASTDRFIAQLEKHLYAGHWAIIFDDRTNLFFVDDGDTSSDLMDGLVFAEDAGDRAEAVLEYIVVSGVEQPVPIPSSRWLQVFESSSTVADEFVSYQLGYDPVGEGEISVDASPAESDVGTAPEVVTLSDAEVEATRWWVFFCFEVSEWMFVLDIIGMLLVVVGLGILLQHRPAADTQWSTIVETRTALLVMRTTLILSGAFGAFDLLATLMTHASGEFVELNPIGAQLIDHPALLTLFKVVAMGLGLGLLWRNRRYAGAQLASWWVSLVMMLVTARWVTVQSLFYV